MNERTTRTGAWFALGVLVVVSVFAAIDRQILTIAIEPVRAAFALSDLQIGLIQGLGLTLVAAFAGFPLAWAADRIDRRLILAVCILAWSAATAARGFAQDFDHLMAGTIGLAVAEAGLGPIVYSMIPAMFPDAAQRARANLIFFSAAMIGGALGMGLAGLAFRLIGGAMAWLPASMQGFEPWRVAFLLAALPGLALAAMVTMIRPEHGRPSPRPSVQTAAPGHGPSFLAHLRRHAGTLAAPNSAASAAFAPITAWLAPAMARRFALAPGDIGVALGGVLGAGVIGGVAMAAIAVRRWGARHGGILGLRVGRHLALVAALCAGLLPLATAPWMAYAATGLMFASAGAFFALLPGVWQEVAPAALRARMLAFSGALTTLATAGGPVLVGGLSVWLGEHEPGGLLLAVALASAPCMALAALLLGVSAEPVRRLLAEVRALDDEGAKARLPIAKAVLPASH
ncbi:MFS transporter [Pelomonas sp. KK5]|uniref:MFS transporter n=1 Tax=Pelomonas sp. KK5 TaxID=1855730 RepID=UPI0009FB660A|nr:MFS transporter [Pelomonas sp. KK5]